MQHHAAQAEQSHQREPDQHDGPEGPADFRRAQRLQGKQADQNDDGRRQHIGLQRRRGDIEASIADSTEMAGVMAPSPYMSAAPNRPTATIAGRCCFLIPSNAMRARMPPSPSLSMVMANRTYLIDVTTISVQSRSDSTPSTTSARRRASGQVEDGLERIERAGADIAEHDASAESPRAAAAAGAAGLIGRGGLARRHAAILLLIEFHEMVERAGSISGFTSPVRRLRRPACGRRRRLSGWPKAKPTAYSHPICENFYDVRFVLGALGDRLHTEIMRQGDDRTQHGGAAWSARPGGRRSGRS